MKEVDINSYLQKIQEIEDKKSAEISEVQNIAKASKNELKSIYYSRLLFLDKEKYSWIKALTDYLESIVKNIKDIKIEDALIVKQIKNIDLDISPFIEFNLKEYLPKILALFPIVFLLDIFLTLRDHIAILLISNLILIVYYLNKPPIRDLILYFLVLSFGLNWIIHNPEAASGIIHNKYIQVIINHWNNSSFFAKLVQLEIAALAYGLYSSIIEAQKDKLLAKMEVIYGWAKAIKESLKG